MKRRCIGDKLQIQCYKHNKEVHRAWDEAVLLKEENSNYNIDNNTIYNTILAKVHIY
mgnify:CR=1 FL=1